MRIVVAGDHSTLELKPFIVEHVRSLGHEVHDLGTHSPDSTDYPLWGKLAADKVAAGEYDRGILICGTGVGIGITANKVHGIRCGIVSDPFSAKMSRAHNDANMIAFGARVVGPELAAMIVDEFLTTDFEGGERHARRVREISEVDAGEQLPRP
ncbi:MAG: ribose 5-phosphate isomerase B [Propionibacteriaceae bacterium]|jgi:ribose 5-phosphate isomerase B|nr:ribose 5-phosphate isomerase B [Propionibacteriaceae bacterium]